MYLLTVDVSDPCSSEPCPVNSYCNSISSKEFVCICKDGFSPSKKGSKLGGCFLNCNHSGEIWFHGEKQGPKECIDGRIETECSVNNKIVKHGKSILMDDLKERLCENGVMKLEKCKTTLSAT